MTNNVRPLNIGEFTHVLSRCKHASTLFPDVLDAFVLFEYLHEESDAKVTMTTLDNGTVQVYATLTN